MNKKDIRLLYEYNRWANTRIFEAVLALKAEQFTRDLGGSHRSVRDTLVHIVSGEWIWLKRWQKQSPKAMFDPAEFPDVCSVQKKYAEIEREQRNFIQRVTEASLKKTVAYENLKGETWRYQLGYMMLHLVNHSTYHRGQVVTMLRQLGAEPVATDFLVYLDLKLSSDMNSPAAKALRPC